MQTQGYAQPGEGCKEGMYAAGMTPAPRAVRAVGGRLVPAPAAQSLAPGMQGGEHDTYSRGCPSSSSRKY